MLLFPTVQDSFSVRYCGKFRFRSEIHYLRASQFPSVDGHQITGLPHGLAAPTPGERRHYTEVAQDR